MQTSFVLQRSLDLKEVTEKYCSMYTLHKVFYSLFYYSEYRPFVNVSKNIHLLGSFSFLIMLKIRK